MKSNTKIIIDTLIEKIQSLQNENSFLLSDLGVYTREKERLDKENKELKEKLMPAPPLDLETPEGYYQSLEAVSFNNKEWNYFVFYCTSQKLFIVSANMEDYSIGTKYISKADAEAFCEKFNK